jgi:hypothetical protein
VRFSIVVIFLLAPSQCFFDLIEAPIVCRGYCWRFQRDKRIVVLVVRIDIASAAIAGSDSVSVFPPIADVAIDVAVVVDEDLLDRDEDKSNFGCLWCGRRNGHSCGLPCNVVRCGILLCVTSRRVFEPKQKPIGRKLSILLWQSHLVFCYAILAASDDSFVL